ncbi:MAG: DUF1461 domain-containing protein [Candidatus Woesearchaeota archaeon]
MKSLVKNSLIIIAFLSLFCFFILLGLKLAFSETYLNFIYSFDSIKPDDNFIYPYSFRLEYAKKTLNLILENNYQNQENLFFTEREINHLKDVSILLKKLFLIKDVLFIVAIISLIFIYLIMQKTTIKILNLLLLFLKIYIFLVLLLFIFSSIFFRIFFTSMHKLFFEENTWIFDKEDLIIQLFPPNFWYIGTIFYFAMLEFLFIFYFIMLKYLKTMKSETSTNDESKGK